MFIVGIDIAKRSHEAIIIAEDGQVVRKAFSFRNNCTGYNLLLEQVRRLTLVKSQIVFAMESTAHYWLALYARLLKDGYTVMVLNPIQSHSLRELYIPGNLRVFLFEFFLCFLKKYLLVLLIDSLTFFAVCPAGKNPVNHFAAGFLWLHLIAVIGG